jgi:hypothetical protein
VGRPQRRCKNQQSDGEPGGGKSPADNDGRAGEGQVEMGMGKHMPQLGHVGKYHGFAQHRPLGRVGKGKPAAQREHHRAGE